jgi:hypothetical protein
MCIKVYIKVSRPFIQQLSDWKEALFVCSILFFLGFLFPFSFLLSSFDGWSLVCAASDDIPSSGAGGL